MRIYFLVLFTLVFNSAIAKDHSRVQQQRQIEVTGVGSVFSVPDRFSFSMSIEQKGRVAAELNKAIVEKTNGVVQALLKIGIDKKSLQSLQVQFNPWVEYNGQTQEQKGFILTRQITVTVNSLSQYEQSIDTVLNLGVNNINQFNFTNSQADENYQVALNHALLNAKQRATNMAKVLDLKIAGVISILEQSISEGTPIMMQSRQFKSSESYQPGEMSTQANVKVIFALQDGT
ncbi:SIMPL domain-containing protein [Paraglaciecola arctica]|uniref:26 kDa periplasmic immunogenic protein n=1 Tax=Paraglaciecola arctica BSs20135 TaxID=493475 RepID=K6Y0E7_9ALTE|nr:SIMPL domain-containing protein [Paraglaciecola arctica]GAC17356.1 hypothetical protein GARC_0374 [Paraglaciecola arctica BSs20135]